jgi:hypothetical protein
MNGFEGKPVMRIELMTSSLPMKIEILARADLRYRKLGLPHVYLNFS